MGMALVASDGEVEFRTLRGEARVFCAMQGGIKQWERGQALCIHRADLLYVVKYTMWSNRSSHGTTKREMMKVSWEWR